MAASTQSDPEIHHEGHEGHEEKLFTMKIVKGIKKFFLLLLHSFRNVRDGLSRAARYAGCHVAMSETMSPYGTLWSAFR